MRLWWVLGQGLCIQFGECVILTVYRVYSISFTQPRWVLIQYQHRNKVTDLFLCLRGEELNSLINCSKMPIVSHQTVTGGGKGEGLQIGSVAGRVRTFCSDDSFLLKLLEHFLYSSTATSGAACLLRSCSIWPQHASSQLRHAFFVQYFFYYLHLPGV